MAKILTENSTELAELRGQMVDILEDALTEKGATIQNEDRDAAIEDGEDEEELAIIYGEDYDVIGDVVQELILDGGLEGNPVRGEVEQQKYVEAVFASYEELIGKAEFPDGGFTEKEIAELKKSIGETFANWKLFA